MSVNARFTTARSQASRSRSEPASHRRAGPSEILVSQTVRDLVAGTGINVTDRDTHVLKGVPGTWQLFAFSPTAHD